MSNKTCIILLVLILCCCICSGSGIGVIILNNGKVSFSFGNTSLNNSSNNGNITDSDQRKYEDPNKLYSFVFPTGWREEYNPKYNEVTILAPDDDESDIYNENIIVRQEDTMPGMSLDDYVQQEEDIFTKNTDTFIFKSSEGRTTLELDGIRGIKTAYNSTINPKTSAVNVRETILFVIKGGKLFRIFFNTEEGQEQRYQSVLDNLIKTIKFN